MRALVLTSLWPNSPPDRTGVAHRFRLLMDGLGAVADRVDIAHLVPSSVFADFPDLAALSQSQSRNWGRKVEVMLVPLAPRRFGFVDYYMRGIFRAAQQPDISAFAGPEPVAAIGRLLDRDYDLVLVHRLAVMCAVLSSGRRPRDLIFDLDDVEHHTRFRQTIQPPVRPGKLATLAQLPALVLAERRSARLARSTLVCAPKDIARRSWRGLSGKFSVIPNAVAVPASAPGLTKAPHILFVGSIAYHPNREAAERLITAIFPLIRRQIPNARLLLAGEGSDALASRKQNPEGVSYLGFVPDLAPLYADSRLVCCPLYNGGGTRVKLVEAAAFARPMVATRIAAEGLEFRDGQEILLRDDDEALADACIRLIRDDVLSAELGANARAQVVALYDRTSIVARIGDLMRTKPAAA